RPHPRHPTSARHPCSAHPHRRGGHAPSLRDRHLQRAPLLMMAPAAAAPKHRRAVATETQRGPAPAGDTTARGGGGGRTCTIKVLIPSTSAEVRHNPSQKNPSTFRM